MNGRVYSLALMAVVCIALLQGCPERRATVSVSESGNIIVRRPQPGDRIQSPVTVSGQARVFEAALSARVRSDTGQQLGIAHFTATAGGPEFGGFSGEIVFTRPAGATRGTVEVYSISAKDGSVINLVRIPVRF